MRLKLVLIIKAVILQFLIQWETSYRQAPMLVPSLAFPRGCCHTWNTQHFYAKVFIWDISGPQVIASAASDGSYETPEGQSPLLPLSLGFYQHSLPHGTRGTELMLLPTVWQMCLLLSSMCFERLTPYRINQPSCSELSCWLLEGHLEVVNCVLWRPITFKEYFQLV